MRFITQHIKWLLLHIVLLLILFLVYRMYTFNKFNVTHEPFAWKMLWYAFRYDMRMISIVVLPVLLFSGFKGLSPFNNKGAKKLWQVYFTIAYILILLFFVSDFQYYAYRTTRLDAEIISFMKDAAISAKMVWQSYPVLIILAILAIVIIAVFVLIKLIHKWASKFSMVNSKRNKVVASMVFGFLLAFSIYGKLGQFPLRWSDAFAQNNDYRAMMSLNPMQSFFSSLKFTQPVTKASSVLPYYSYVQKALQLPSTDTTTLNYTRNFVGNNAANKPNIVVVLCESFSMYKSSMTGNPLNATPYFNALSKEGIFFTNCFSPAYGTARGVWATITGVPDVTQVKTASRNPRAVNQYSIMSSFKDYEKYYFLGGDATWANIRGLLKNNIDNLHLYEEPDYESSSVDVWGISDRSLFTEATNKLNKVKAPFFTIIQTSSNHRPFTIPQKDRTDMGILNKPLDSLLKFGFNVESNLERTNAEYNSVRYMDFCINEFIQNAKKQAWYNNTIFLFVGDHGIRGQGASMIPKVYTEKGLTCQHIPMLIYSPLLKPAQYDFPCSQLDVLPTLAGLANISYKNTALGRDVLKVASDSTALKYAFIMDHDRKEYGLVMDGHYYVKTLDGRSKELLPLKPGNSPIQSINFYDNLTEGLMRSSNYLIFNNKNK
jgi:phosphoglycerol transferase MdoB-like AlkP superfamily enzyme